MRVSLTVKSFISGNTKNTFLQTVFLIEKVFSVFFFFIIFDVEAALVHTFYLIDKELQKSHYKITPVLRSIFSTNRKI